MVIAIPLAAGQSEDRTACRAPEQHDRHGAIERNSIPAKAARRQRSMSPPGNAAA
jgi:hypothetical protein